MTFFLFDFFKKFSKRFGKILSVFPEVISALVSMAWCRLRGRRIIIIQVSTPGFVQFALPIFEELNRNRNIKISFYFSLRLNFPEQLVSFGQVSHLRWFSEDCCRFMFMADAYLMTEIYDRGPASAVKIMIGHGQPVKHQRFPAKYLKNIDVYCLYGKLLREILETAALSEPDSIKHITMIETGQPKTDPLYDGTFRRDQILAQLRLDANKKTLLYAPAWDPGGSLREYGKEIITVLLSIPDTNLVVKLHPVSLEPQESPEFQHYTGGIIWEKEFEHFESYPNFRFYTDYNINPLLIAADVMIGDFSGVAQTFMTLDKPVVYIDCPKFYEETVRERGYEADRIKNDERFNAGRNRGVVVSSMEELRVEVIDALENPSKLSSLRNELSEKLLSFKGNAKKVMAQEIIKIINNKKQYIKNKR